MSLTQEQFAAKVGLTLSTVNRWESAGGAHKWHCENRVRHSCRRDAARGEPSEDFSGERILVHDRIYVTHWHSFATDLKGLIPATGVSSACAEN